MVIRDENGKAVILLNKKDILDYIFEKCGMEVGIEAEQQFNQADEAFDEDSCEGCDVLAQRDEEIEELQEALSQMEQALCNQKQKYVKYLKSKKFSAAAALLEDYDEVVGE